MKKFNYVLFIFCFLLVWSCSNDKVEVTPTIVSVEISENKELPSGKQIFLKDYINREVIDTLKFNENTQTYQAEIKNTVENAYFLSVNNQTIPNSAFITKNEPVSAIIHIPDDEEVYEIKLTSKNESFNSYNSYKKSIIPEEEKIERLEESYNNDESKGLFIKDKNLQQRYDDEWDLINDSKMQKLNEFIDTTKNLAALYVFDREKKYSTSYDELNNLLKSFDNTEITKTPLYEHMDIFRGNLKAIAKGEIAPNFKAPNPDGEELSVEDFRGEYLLIDFWASWCKPCRKANPELVELYEIYHPKGVEFLGVSYDYPGARAQWLDAIRDDHLTWPQISKLKGWDTDSQELYSVFGIPYQVLLDKEGKILANNKEIQEKGLSKILAEL